MVAAPARTVKVTVGAKPKTSVSFGSVKVAKGGKLTVSGTIKPGAPSSGATIEVLAMKTAGGPPEVRREDHRQGQVAARRSSPRTFKLKPGFRWVLRLVNKQTGQSTSDTGLKTVNVK